MNLYQQSLRSNHLYPFLWIQEYNWQGFRILSLSNIGHFFFVLFFQVTSFCQFEIIFWCPPNVWFGAWWLLMPRLLPALAVSQSYLWGSLQAVGFPGQHRQAASHRRCSENYFVIKNSIWSLIFEDGLCVCFLEEVTRTVFFRAGLIGDL